MCNLLKVTNGIWVWESGRNSLSQLVRQLLHQSITHSVSQLGSQSTPKVLLLLLLSTESVFVGFLVGHGSDSDSDSGCGCGYSYGSDYGWAPKAALGQEIDV